MSAAEVEERLLNEGVKRCFYYMKVLLMPDKTQAS